MFKLLKPENENRRPLKLDYIHDNRTTYSKGTIVDNVKPSAQLMLHHVKIRLKTNQTA